jgi:valyl-tRNA synthetase
MIMMGLEFTGKIPFEDVYLHGIIRDKTGKKMSKSLGSVIDPVDLINKYGTDAVRFALTSQAYTGKDIPFSEDSIIGARNFCNKIYNAARFVLMNLPKDKKILKLPAKITDLSDKWILDRFNNILITTEKQFKKFEFADISNNLYHFLWGDLCDWYLELAKPRLQSKEKEDVFAILVHILYGTLKALHPIMPFITEELTGSLKPYVGDSGKFLIHENYPQADKSRLDKEPADRMNLIMGAVTAIRTIRSHFHITSNEKISVIVNTKNKNSLGILKDNIKYLTLLANIENIETGEKLAKPPHSATAVFGDFTFFVPLEGKIDLAREKTRLEKELDKLENQISQSEKQLKNSQFINNAPKEQIEKIKTRLKETVLKAGQVKSALKDLQ